MKISFIGTGVFSLAVAINLAQNKGNKIMMWSENLGLVQEFQEKHTLSQIKLNNEIPDNICVSNDYQAVLQDTQIVFIIPAMPYLRGACENIKPFLNSSIPVIIGTKGIEDKAGKFAIEIAQEILTNPCYIMSGASLAQDMANLDLIGLTIGYKEKKGLDVVKQALNIENIALEFIPDKLAINVSSVLKNIYAIGAGMLYGLGYQKSTNAFYVDLVYQEMQSIFTKLHFNKYTITSYAGLADLIFTCTSSDSRNFNLGQIIAKKENIEDYLSHNTVEGYNSLEAMNMYLNKKKITAPIFQTIYAIIYEKAEIQELVTILSNI